MQNKSLVDDPMESNMGLEGSDKSLEELQKLVGGDAAPSKQKTMFMNSLMKNASPEVVDKLNKMSGTTVKTGPGTDTRGILSNENRMQQGQLSGLASLKPEDKPVVSGVDSFDKDKSGGAPAVGGFDASKYAADDGFNTQVKGGISDLLNSDPQKAVDFAARTPAEQAFMAKMLKERSDMRDNMMNPDKLSNDRLMQTLLGAKGATAGEAFRTSGLAGVNAERSQEKLRRSEFDALNKLYMTEADRSQGIKQKAFEGSQADKKQGVTSGSSLTANEQLNALNADKLLQDISDSKVKNEIQKGANKLKEQTNSILAQGNTIKSNSDMIRLYEGEETKTRKSLETNAANALKLIFGDTKKDNDKRNKIRAGLAADVKKFAESYAAKRKKYEVNLAGLTTAKTGGISEVDKILGIK